MSKNTKFLELLKELDINIPEEILSGKLQAVLINQKLSTFTFLFEFPVVPKVEFLNELINKIQQIYLKKFKIKEIKFNFIYKNKFIKESSLEEYYNYIVTKLSEYRPHFSMFNAFTKNFSNSKVVFYVGCNNDQKVILQFIEAFKKGFAIYGLDFINIETDISPFEKSIEEEIKIKMDNISASIKREQIMFDGLKEKSPNRGSAPLRSRKSKLPINGEATPLIDLPSTNAQLVEYQQKHNSNNFVVEGDLIKAEIRAVTGYNLFQGVIYDGESSLVLKSFISENNSDHLAFYQANCIEGKKIKAYGLLQYDKYSKDLTLSVQDVVPLGEASKKSRTDTYPEKRVELHAHTKMSAQDSVMDINEYVELAKNFGHKALTVTDHVSLQGLPDFELACNNADIKPIFGLEGNLVLKDEYNICLTEADVDISLEDASFVVYDLETTGLSSNYNEIIEISAVRIRHGILLDEFSTFVKPRKPIPKFITNFTQISNDDVRNAKSIEEVLPEFLSFIGSSILVAHNARFDNSMLYANLKNIGLYSKDFPTIDTLQLARNFYSDKVKRFNLKALSKFFDVDLVQHHRAIYDTRATAGIFLRMLNELKERKITTYNSINKNISDDAYQTIIPYHLTLLAKNRKGIVNLNKIVSDSSTIHFHKEPRILEDFLKNHREGLLIGSGCQNGEVFITAFNGSEEKLKEVINFYDYIEVQPPKHYRYLFSETFKVFDEDEETENNSLLEEQKELEEEYMGYVYETIKKIIKVSKELNKPVVATGDVHHLNKEDVMLRAMFVEAPQVGGGIHYLARVGELVPQYYMSTNEMMNEFSFLDNDVAFEIIVKNSNYIANMIETFTLFPKGLYAPSDNFFADKGIPSMKESCMQLTYSNAKKIYGENIPKYIIERLEKELNSIIGNNYAPIYYVSYLLVKHSTDAGYVVGSRGSVGSSLVATFMNITEVNPLLPHYVCKKCQYSAFKFTQKQKEKYGINNYPEYIEQALQNTGNGYDLPENNCPVCGHLLKGDGMDIPFETFLGFSGEKIPDIDLNFSGEYQNVAHDYIRDLFGEEKAFRAGTISTVASKTAYGYVKKYLEKHEIQIRQSEVDRLSKKIEGVKRSTGQHPGGIVVIPKEIDVTDIIAIQYPSDNLESTWRTTHYDYHKFEDNLLKLDILGHDDPTMVKYLMDFVKENPNEFPFTDVDEIPLSDPKVLSLFNSVKALGVEKEQILQEIGTSGLPEFGTRTAKDMLKDINPSKVEQLIKTSGISHGTDVWNNNQRDYLLGIGSNKEPIPFEQLIGCRDDIMVYLIKMGMPEFDAFTIMERVRKGKSLTIEQESEMRAYNIPDWYILSCKKIQYMFPKAHAAAYVIMALRIGWFKIHHPIYYYSSFFSIRCTAFDVEVMAGGYEKIKNKIMELQKVISQRNAKQKDLDLFDTLTVALEMTARGFHFEMTNLKKSDWKNFNIEGNKLYLPFNTIDSLGNTTAKSIVEARKEAMFTSKNDFKKRTKVSSTVLERMDRMGILDGLPDDDQTTLF